MAVVAGEHSEADGVSSDRGLLIYNRMMTEYATKPKGSGGTSGGGDYMQQPALGANGTSGNQAK